MSKFLHAPPKFSSGLAVVRGPSVGDRWTRGPWKSMLVESFCLFTILLNTRSYSLIPVQNSDLSAITKAKRKATQSKNYLLLTLFFKTYYTYVYCV
jgi:hypothetical protein